VFLALCERQPFLLVMVETRCREFATIADCFAEQQRRFASDSLLRRGILAGRSLKATTTMMPAVIAKYLSDKLYGKNSIVAYITTFMDTFLIPNFVEELKHCSISTDRAVTRQTSIIAVHPTSTVIPVHSMELFRCFFYLYAGPVARVHLPEGCFFTGSLCCAAACIPGEHVAKLIDIEQLWDAFCHMDDYDGFVLAMNSLFGQDLSYYPKFGRIKEQSWLREEDGEGPLARSDVDIIVTAQSNGEARAKIHSIVKSVTDIVGECAVVATPNAFTICAHFPLKHVQVIVLWTRSILDYLLFVDLDCTALAYDGFKLFGTDRALLAHLGKFNYITSSMLEIRRDTPCRVGKKAQLGFGTFVTTPHVAQGEQWQKAIKQSLDKPPEFFNDGHRIVLETNGGIHPIEEMVEALTQHAGSYSETKLPRGHYVSPDVVQAFLIECHVITRRQGKNLIAHDMTRLVRMFPTSFPISFVNEKLMVKTEAWWREWNMIPKDS